MTPFEIKLAGRRLRALRAKIAALAGDEEILSAQVAKAMQVNKLDALWITRELKLVREQTKTRTLDAAIFSSFVAGRFVGNALDSLCDIKKGPTRVRIIDATGHRKGGRHG